MKSNNSSTRPNSSIVATIEVNGNLLNLRSITKMDSKTLLVTIDGNPLKASAESFRIIKEAKEKYESDFAELSAQEKIKEEFRKELVQIVRDQIKITLQAEVDKISEHQKELSDLVKTLKTEVEKNSRDLNRKINNITEIDFEIINKNSEALEKITKVFSSLL